MVQILARNRAKRHFILGVQRPAPPLSCARRGPKWSRPGAPASSRWRRRRSSAARPGPWRLGARRERCRASRRRRRSMPARAGRVLDESDTLLECELRRADRRELAEISKQVRFIGVAGCEGELGLGGERKRRAGRGSRAFAQQTDGVFDAGVGKLGGVRVDQQRGRAGQEAHAEIAGAARRAHDFGSRHGTDQPRRCRVEVEHEVHAAVGQDPRAPTDAFEVPESIHRACEAGGNGHHGRSLADSERGAP